MLLEVWCSMFVGCCLLLGVWRLPFVVRWVVGCLMFIVWSCLFVDCYVLLVVSAFLFVVS